MASISVHAILEGLDYSPLPHILIAEDGHFLGQNSACESLFESKTCIQDLTSCGDFSDLDRATQQVKERAAAFFHSLVTIKKISFDGRSIAILAFSPKSSFGLENEDAKRLLLDNLNILSHLLSPVGGITSLKGAKPLLKHALEKYVFYQGTQIGCAIGEPSEFCIAESFRKIINSKSRLCGPNWTIDFIVLNEEEKVFLDRKKIEFILKEFLENCTNHNEKGTITVTLSFEGSFLELVVENVGEPFSPRMLERFGSPRDSFFSERLEGGCVGLLVCEKLIKQMGGKFSIYNQDGERVTVKCRVPRDQAFEVLPSLKSSFSDPVCLLRRRSEEIGVSIQGIFSSRCALIVDDNPVNGPVLGSLLKGLGGSYECAKTHQEAFRKLGERKFDVIFMDLNMPVVDGCSLAKQIKEIQKDVPIVGWSTDQGREKECQEAGMEDRMLGKPATRVGVRNILNWLFYR